MLAAVNLTLRKTINLSDHLDGCLKWSEAELLEAEERKGKPGRPLKPSLPIETDHAVSLAIAIDAVPGIVTRLAVKAGRLERLRKLCHGDEAAYARIDAAQSELAEQAEGAFSTLYKTGAHLSEVWSTLNVAHLTGEDAAQRNCDGYHWGSSDKGDPERNTRGANHDGERRDNNRSAAAISGGRGLDEDAILEAATAA